MLYGSSLLWLPYRPFKFTSIIIYFTKSWISPRIIPNLVNIIERRTPAIILFLLRHSLSSYRSLEITSTYGTSHDRSCKGWRFLFICTRRNKRKMINSKITTTKFPWSQFRTSTQYHTIYYGLSKWHESIEKYSKDQRNNAEEHTRLVAMARFNELSNEMFTIYEIEEIFQRPRQNWFFLKKSINWIPTGQRGWGSNGIKLRHKSFFCTRTSVSFRDSFIYARIQKMNEISKTTNTYISSLKLMLNVSSYFFEYTLHNIGIQ